MCVHRTSPEFQSLSSVLGGGGGGGDFNGWSDSGGCIYVVIATLKEVCMPGMSLEAKQQVQMLVRKSASAVRPRRTPSRNVAPTAAIPNESPFGYEYAATLSATASQTNAATAAYSPESVPSSCCNCRT